MKTFDLAVVGGGASGLFAACAAAGRGCSVVILEAADRIGKKLLQTGNGQGNITAAELTFEKYHGTDPAFCIPALEAFGNEDAKALFGRLGLLTVTEDKKVFPLSKQAGSVLEILRIELNRLGVEILTDFSAASAVKKQYFEVSDGNKTVYSDHLLIATGGKSSPTSKKFDAGYDLARSFGHKVTPLFPSLVQLKGDVSEIRVLKGIKTDVRLTLADRNTTYFSDVGEILFCDYGISGKIVFDGSSRIAGASFSELSAYIDFLPQFSQAETCELLRKRAAGLPHLAPDQLLSGIAKSQVARAVLARAKLSKVEFLSKLSESELERVAGLLKNFSIKLFGPHSFELAQVTHGGVRTDRLDPLTMESRLCPGLFFSGEIIDVDGDCGGFNLQWCWSSANAAAVRIAETKSPHAGAEKTDRR